MGQQLLHSGSCVARWRTEQQLRESLISCLKVMLLLNQVLFSPKTVILMDRGTKEEHFVMIQRNHSKES